MATQYRFLAPQRALALARIEAEHGVPATYFVQLSSRFYSAFEPEVAAVLRNIVALGHDMGLHFNAGSAHTAWRLTTTSALPLKRECWRKSWRFVWPLLRSQSNDPCRALINDKSHAGLINGSCPAWRERYQYLSDSNGIWRFRNLAEMIADPANHRLYALTIRNGGGDVARERLQRCIDGRAAFGSAYYDGLLAANDRPNIGASK